MASSWMEIRLCHIKTGAVVDDLEVDGIKTKGLAWIMTTSVRQIIPIAGVDECSLMVFTNGSHAAVLGTPRMLLCMINSWPECDREQVND